jgi:DNA-nicking Smr family endonuclease
VKALAPKFSALKATSLADLQAIQSAITQARTQAALDAATALAAAQKAWAEQNLFVRAAGAVQPLPDRQVTLLPRPRPSTAPRQQLLDDQAVLREAISDDFDVSTLLEVDDTMSFRRPGIGTGVTRKLRQGDWRIQRELDLHGLRRDEAREALASFIRDACKQGLRCLRIVHGKGLGSPGKAPVLKSKVQSWLVQKQEVLAFVQARPSEGGAGALVVLLRPGGNN